MIKHSRAYMLLAILLLLTLTAVAQTDNPFEIQNRVGTVLADSLVQEADTFSLDKHVSFVEQRQQMLIDENPFNVSHIPYKSKNIQVEQVDIDVPVAEEDNRKQTVSRDFVRRTNVGANKFMFWFFLIQLLLITSILGINREFIRKINRSISNDNFAKLVSRDYNGGFDALFVIMYALFVLSLSIFIYLTVRQFYGIAGFSRFAIILASVFGVYLFRHIFLGFMGFVFPFTKTVSYYNFMIVLFNSYLGLLLIPVNILMAYAPEFIANFAVYIGMIFIAITYLLRLLRGSLHAYTLVRNNVFHFFLYLCTCEIAPIFILVKFLSNSFSI